MLRFCSSRLTPSQATLTNIRWLHTTSARWQQSVQVEVSKDGKKLKLLCEGEQERRFHGVWLRHNCRCPVCTSVHTNQTIVNPKDLVKGLKVESAHLDGEKKNVASR